ncbi:MAG: hypothetical protein VYA62_14370, partial [Planctomycetota bacterium]|nr:hypothetical protein [Planctomycetota bacterium]
MMNSPRRPGFWTLTRPLQTAIVLLLASTAAAQAPPTISTTRPLAVRPGQAVDMTIQGANLVGVRDVWTS